MSEVRSTQCCIALVQRNEDVSRVMMCNKLLLERLYYVVVRVHLSGATIQPFFWYLRP